MSYIGVLMSGLHSLDLSVLHRCVAAVCCTYDTVVQVEAVNFTCVSSVSPRYTCAVDSVYLKAVYTYGVC